MQTSTSPRRKFIGKSLWGVSSLFIPYHLRHSKGPLRSWANLARSDTTVFICESGNLGQDPVFTLGLLLVPKPDDFENKLRTLRNQLSYFPRLGYSNNDRYQLPLAEAAIHWLFNESRCQFQVMAFDEKISSTNPDYPHAPSRWQLVRHKQACYDKLLDKAGINGQMIYVKYQSPLGPSAAYGQHFFAKSACYYQPIDTRASNALQMCSLLTGCVAAAAQNRDTSPIKQALIEQLKAVLEQQHLQPALRWKDRFVFYV